MTDQTDPLEAARRDVVRWLAQWGIHNDAEIGGLLDTLIEAASPRPAGVEPLASKALAAVVEWSRRYRGPFGYATQHDFTRERFDPIAREYAALTGSEETRA